MVTVGIVFFNTEEFLAEAINSVFAQTYPYWKLILINDGSTDGSEEIARRYLFDERVSFVSDGKNLGLTIRLNTLIKNCETRYFCRMDADDIMVKHRIKCQVDILDRFCEIDILGSNAYLINGSSNVTGIRYKFNCFEILTAATLIHPTVMARTSWFKENLYDREFINRGQDMELWFRLRNSTTLFFVSEPLLFYRELAIDYAKKYRQGFFEQIFLVRKYNREWRVYIMLIRYVLALLLFHTPLKGVLLRRRNYKNFSSQFGVVEHKSIN